MVDDYRAKFDPELRDIHTSFLDLQRGNRDRVYPHHSKALQKKPISLLLQFGDDLAGIEARGFRTEWVEGHFARGDVDLTDLEAVASHPEVIQLAYGGGFKPTLDHSTIELDARGPGKIWDVTGSGVFSGSRGTNVLIGIIDTGIDITHPVFLKEGSTDTTRIVRIWDMGITAHDGLKPPDVGLLKGNITYGVEYTEEVISKFLQKKAGPPVKHRDCHGHGTHVASIAAGDGQAKQGKKQWQFVGVASAANLIIVKFFYLQEEPPVDEQRRFEDAVTYIERVAATPDLHNRPVMINASLGDNLGPHDGLTPWDQFLANHFVPATKKAFVAAAGNDGGQRQHALIVIPSVGHVDIPFTLYDERHDLTSDTSRCDRLDNAQPEMKIEFWYRPPPSPATLTSTLHPPKGPAVDGPPLGGTVTKTYPDNRTFMISHDQDKAKRPPVFDIARNVLRIKFLARDNSYGTGKFTLRLTGPEGTKIRGYADQFFEWHGIRFGHDKPGKAGSDENPDPMKRLKLPLPAGVTLPDSETINSPASSDGAIAVVSYNDRTGNLQTLSSQGPLADYADLPPVADKPDVAAPGEKITAANGKTSFLSDLAKLDGQPGGFYTTWGATSSASPHVAGVAALMLEKKPNLTRADLVTQLKGTARATPPKEKFGDGKVDAKKSFDAV